MIILHTEPYCENCPDFDAVTDMHVGGDARGIVTLCNIYCEHHAKCKKMCEFLKKKMNIPEENKDTPLVAYICDNEACLNSCNASMCTHTTDITHAVNFKRVQEASVDFYMEKMEGEDDND